MKKTLYEKMRARGVPKSWLSELRSLELAKQSAELRAEEYGLTIDKLAVENALLNKRVAEYEDIVSEGNIA